MSILFNGDFSTGDFAQWPVVQNKFHNSSGSSYDGSGALYSARIMEEGGVKFARFELHDGDIPFSNTERTEAQGPLISSGGQEGQERWYRWQTRFHATFPADGGAEGFGLAQQWHDESPGSPPVGWYTDVGNGEWGLRIQQQSSPGVFINSLVIWKTGLNKGSWHDIKMRIRWSASDSLGLVQLWYNGNPQTFTGGPGVGTTTTVIRTLVPGGGATYAKLGYFRSQAVSGTGIVDHKGFVAATAEADVSTGGGEEPPPPPPPPAPPVTPVGARRKVGWQFVIGPASGGHELALTAAKSRKLVARLTSPSEASFVIDGRHSQARAVDELATDLHALYTPPGGGPTAILYRGRIGPTADDLGDTAHALTVTSMDYREVLARRILYASSTLTWTGTDQAEIAWQLVQQTQTRTGGDLRISKGIGNPSGVNRDRTYTAGDSIGERIQELSEVIGGFDWDVRPASASALTLDIWGARGADRGVVLEYGGMVSSVRRQVDVGEYANSIRVTGDQAADTPPTPQERTVTDIATRPEGRWDKAATATGITTTAALSERADWLLDDAQVVVPSYTLTLRPGAWQGPDHIWVGDTVSVVIKSGRLRVTGVPYRVQEMTIELPDDGGREQVAVTVGRPRKTPGRREATLFRRLTDVERR